jgi:hypothetical protein
MFASLHQLYSNKYGLATDSPPDGLQEQHPVSRTGLSERGRHVAFEVFYLAP